MGSKLMFGKGRSVDEVELRTPSLLPPPPLKQLAAASQPWPALTSMKATHMKATQFHPYPMFFEIYYITSPHSDYFATQDDSWILVSRKGF